MSHGCPLDRVIRGTFEWREVANMLGSFGLHQPEWRLGNRHARVVGETAYRTAGALAHRDPAFVHHLRTVFDRLYERERREVAAMGLEDLGQVVSQDLGRAGTGWLWAMLTDRREEVVAMAKLWARESVG